MPISLRSMENVAAPQDDRGVYLLDAAEVRTATDGALELSAIWMYPEPGPDAWVARMVVKARAMAGSSPAVELLARAIEAGYRGGEYPGGVRLQGPKTIPRAQSPWEGPVPGGAKIEGWARVDYYDADVEGHAIIPGPGEPPAPFVEARWRLFTRKPDVTIDVDPDPLVVAAGTSETLKIIVVGGPAEAIPAVALGDRSSLPDWVAVDRLEATLAARPRLVEEPDGRRVFDLWVTVPAVERPGARGGSDEASFSLRTTLPGTDAARDHRLVIRSGGIAFPGWVAIDFGTSSLDGDDLRPRADRPPAPGLGPRGAAGRRPPRRAGRPAPRVSWAGGSGWPRVTPYPASPGPRPVRASSSTTLTWGSTAGARPRRSFATSIAWRWTTP